MTCHNMKYVACDYTLKSPLDGLNIKIDNAVFDLVHLDALSAHISNSLQQTICYRFQISLTNTFYAYDTAIRHANILYKNLLLFHAER